MIIKSALIFLRFKKLPPEIVRTKETRIILEILPEKHMSWQSSKNFSYTLFIFSLLLTTSYLRCTTITAEEQINKIDSQ